MPTHMKKHHTSNVANVTWHGSHYIIPLRIIEKYKIKDNNTSAIDEVFGDIGRNTNFGKRGY